MVSYHYLINNQSRAGASFVDTDGIIRAVTLRQMDEHALQDAVVASGLQYTRHREKTKASTHPGSEVPMSTKHKKEPKLTSTAPITPSRVPFSNSADLAAIVELLGDGIITYNLSGDALYYNPAARSILGWDAVGIDPCSLTAQERLDIYQIEIVADDLPHRPSLKHLADQIQKGETMDAQEWRVHCPDGTLVHIQIRQMPIQDRVTGAVMGAVHIFHDITAWREINDIKDEFISVASHELRAPLQPLIMASRFIQRWIDHPEHKQEVIDLAEEVVRQSKRMSRLVADMIDMTRITAGRFNIQLVSCDIAAIVHNVAKEQQAITQRIVQVVPSDATMLGVADDERLWQVVTNLVGNAIKYSLAPTPIVITVAAFSENEALWARICVQDRGCGIPAAQLPHLFERFYRASISHQLAPQHQDSLGLGLYIAHAIVQEHGGRLSVESVVNQGSTFTVEIPVAPRDGSAATAHA